MFGISGLVIVSTPFIDALDYVLMIHFFGQQRG